MWPKRSALETDMGLLIQSSLTYFQLFLFFYVYCWSSLTVTLLLLTQITWWKRWDSIRQLFPHAFFTAFSVACIKWQDEFSAISTYIYIYIAGFLRHPILGIDKEVVKELGGWIYIELNTLFPTILEVENDSFGIETHLPGTHFPIFDDFGRKSSE